MTGFPLCGDFLQHRNLTAIGGMKWFTHIASFGLLGNVWSYCHERLEEFVAEMLLPISFGVVLLFYLFFLLFFLQLERNAHLRKRRHI